MKYSRTIGIMVLALLALMVMAVPSYADSITLSNANQSGFLGQTFTFAGTYTNEGEDVAGDVLHWTSSSPCLTFDPNGCVDDSAFILTATPGQFSSFFDVFVDLNADPGTYFGQFSLVNDAGDSLATADFSVTVAETPEPGSLILLGSGLVGAAGAMRRKILG